MRKKFGRRWSWPVVAVIASLGLGALGAAASSSAKVTSHAKASSKATKKRPAVAFFGFATDNSFAQATWKGVKKEAKAYHGTATFLNGDFSSTTQVQQLQTEIASGKYNVFVVQANDGSAVVPEIKKAIAKGIVVAAEFTQVGSSYAQITPQVPGEISVVESAVSNGTNLGKLAISACKGKSTCNVVYLQGAPTLPLDVARTKAVLAELKTDSHVNLLEDPTGGYLASTGETVTEDVLSAHPNVNVIIGSSQAIEGATVELKSRGLLGKVKLIGNGGSTQAVNFVRAGTWYATFGIPEVTDGATATKDGIEKLQGGNPPTSTNSANLGPAGGLWTKSVVVKNHIKGQYSD
ncbi:MAG TPA: sugar ABC transporter substrate-binding protein [Solirubrobacteraceae bacterium]|jgi:ribose transport system substrate-binding protein|nr:sugar ABC transporter substrate-binding protein [Solirubrobacteraceae bacterium]